MQLSLEHIREWMAAEFAPGSAAFHARGGEPASASGYSIDSRTVQRGDLFFAIHGEHFDGHDFVESAIEAGAAAAVIAGGNLGRYKSEEIRKRLLLVDDPLAAMQRLASSVRRHWGKTCDWHYRQRRENHHQGSHCAGVGNAILRA